MHEISEPIREVCHTVCVGSITGRRDSNGTALVRHSRQSGYASGEIRGALLFASRAFPPSPDAESRCPESRCPGLEHPNVDVLLRIRLEVLHEAPELRH